MKKAVSILLIALFILGITVNAICEGTAVEDYSLHNGTKFGMTKDEVIQIEADAGFELKPYAGTDYMLFGGGTIAGVPNSQIYYHFDGDGKLFQMRYSLNAGYHKSEEDYNKINQMLVEKYGETQYSSKTNKNLPIKPIALHPNAYIFVGNITSKSIDGLGMETVPDQEKPDVKFQMWIHCRQYSEWLFPLKDDGGIIIDHSFYDKCHRFVGPVIGESQADSFEEEIIIYTYLDSNKLNNMLYENMNQAKDDL